MPTVAPLTSSPSASAPLSERAALFAAEPRFAGIEERAGPLPWRTRPRGFAGILRTICGQQISNQAAGAIWRRLSAVPGALTPEGLLELDDATLCGVADCRGPRRRMRAPWRRPAWTAGSTSTGLRPCRMPRPSPS
jgi:3-methyladenine DNA glycosylase/8-oxoguanine DNA glycosylase